MCPQGHGCDCQSPPALLGPLAVATSIEWITSLTALQTAQELTSSAPLPLGSVKGTQEEDIKSGLAQFR